LVVNTDGVGVRREALSEIDTMGNLIRNHTSFGVDAQLTIFGLDFADDAVCGNGDTGIQVQISTTSPTFATGTGLGTVYNAGHGVDFFGSSVANAIQFNDNNAFTANAFCGFSNITGITASAVNNQWRGAVTTCTQSPDVCTGGGQSPIVCDPFQNHVNTPIALDGMQPTFPRNVFLKGQTVRVQGQGFNAIAGNPLAGAVPCALGSSDVSANNCCRNKTKANVCAATGTPPDPPGDGSNCVAIRDATTLWKRLEASSVTPSAIVTEVPDPGLLCVGEGYPRTVRVAKRSGAIIISHEADYCRNVP
jgi:hypothetical protein